MNEELVLKLISRALLELEERGDIVLCVDSAKKPAKHIYDALGELMPNDKLTASELSGLRALVFQATNDQRFFDLEMPTLTGFTADEFRTIARKLPKG
jgi:hypothetical protein